VTTSIGDLELAFRIVDAMLEPVFQSSDPHIRYDCGRGPFSSLMSHLSGFPAFRHPGG
jgi:hypothetical protein